MPIYEFCCEKCHRDFEELCRKGTSGVECPECGSKKVNRKLSTFSYSSGGSTGSTASAAGASTSSKSACSSCVSRSCSSCH